MLHTTFVPANMSLENSKSPISSAQYARAHDLGMHVYARTCIIHNQACEDETEKCKEAISKLKQHQVALKDRQK
jgi:hypothetical protein